MYLIVVLKYQNDRQVVKLLYSNIQALLNGIFYKLSIFLNILYNIFIY